MSVWDAFHSFSLTSGGLYPLIKEFTAARIIESIVRNEAAEQCYSEYFWIVDSRNGYECRVSMRFLSSVEAFYDER